MLDALMLLSAVAAFGYIVIWSLRNDGAASIRSQRGLLRMQPHEHEPAGPSEENSAPVSRRGRRGGDRPGRASGR